MPCQVLCGRDAFCFMQLIVKDIRAIMVNCVKQLLPFAVTPAAGTGGKGADTVQVCRTKPTFSFLRTNQSGADQAKLSVSTLVLEAHALSFTCRMSIP